MIFKITSLCPLTLQGSTGQTQQCSSRWDLIRKPCLSQSLEMNMMSAKVTRRRLDRNWNWVNHSLNELASMDCCHHRRHLHHLFQEHRHRRDHHHDFHHDHQLTLIRHGVEAVLKELAMVGHHKERIGSLWSSWEASVDAL